VNQASVNQDLEAVELNRLKLQVETLQRLLAQERPAAPTTAAVAETVATYAALAQENFTLASDIRKQRDYWKSRVGK